MKCCNGSDSKRGKADDSLSEECISFIPVKWNGDENRKKENGMIERAGLRGREALQYILNGWVDKNHEVKLFSEKLLALYTCTI